MKTHPASQVIFLSPGNRLFSVIAVAIQSANVLHIQRRLRDELKATNILQGAELTGFSIGVLCVWLTSFNSTHHLLEATAEHLPAHLVGRCCSGFHADTQRQKPFCLIRIAPMGQEPCVASCVQVQKNQTCHVSWQERKQTPARVWIDLWVSFLSRHYGCSWWLTSSLFLLLWLINTF